jgi:Fe-S-cluster containining protein
MPSPPAADPDPWYREGLAFTCTRCGDCCTGAPGYVWVNDVEIDHLATHLGLERDDFTRRYVRQVGPRRSLVERPNGDCVFWSRAEGCTVYEARPVQCRTWPFWPQNVATPRDWEHTCQVCPGSGQGTLYTAEQIGRAVRRVVP